MSVSWLVGAGACVGAPPPVPPRVHLMKLESEEITGRPTRHTSRPDDTGQEDPDRRTNSDEHALGTLSREFRNRSLYTRNRFTIASEATPGAYHPQAGRTIHHLPPDSKVAPTSEATPATSPFAGL